MTNQIIYSITRDDVQEAIRDLNSGATPDFEDSAPYDLLFDGKRYAPTAVVGLAARRQLGRPLVPEEFSGGLDSQCFKILEKLGFTIVPKESEQQAGTGSFTTNEELPTTPNVAVWLEMSKKRYERGGPGWELGTCLWSPSSGSDGRDSYALMREAKADDIVIHSNDSLLVGYSFVAQPYTQQSDAPPNPGKWGMRPGFYRVELRDFTRFPRELPLADFIRDNTDAIRNDIESNKPAKYPFSMDSETVGIRQGYLSSCTPGLYELIREAVAGAAPKAITKTGKPAKRRPPMDGRVWAMALGEGGRLWNECQELGIVAIGWDYLGDLRKYSDQNEITKAIVEHDKPESQPTNQSLCCWQFSRGMHIGDTVVAKIGRQRLLGVGTVESDYIYDPSREEYHNVRHVKWTKAKTLDLPGGALLPTKTLTDVTGYKQVVKFVRENYLDETQSPPPRQKLYGMDDALDGLFVPTAQFEAILAAIRTKKNVILQGPPGVGKTFVARRLAWAFLGARDESRLQMVQFHQSYAYEDFIQGWRPTGGGGFELRNGVFYEFCNTARMDLGRRYVFIVDEINRGNISKILGELMMLIEQDKRGSEYAIPLTYSDSGERFSVPENLYVLGLMNTADRSLAMVDYALRRRFRFIDLRPQFDHPAFAEHLRAHQATGALIEKVIDRVGALNKKIEADHKNLGKGFVIGHSFFCLSSPGAIADEDWYQSVIRWEVAPLIEEYWFDRQETARKWIDELLMP